jgi:hypothetical protein
MSNDRTSTSLEDLWDRLLSREAGCVKEAYLALTEEEQEGVLAHLKRMANEPGWHAEQRHSARFALDAIKDN